MNPAVLRTYILEIRKVLGDRPSNPEFIEILKKRGYRFIAPVIDEGAAETPISCATEGHKTEVRAFVMVAELVPRVHARWRVCSVVDGYVYRRTAFRGHETD